MQSMKPTEIMTIFADGSIELKQDVSIADILAISDKLRQMALGVRIPSTAETKQPKDEGQ